MPTVEPKAAPLSLALRDWRRALVAERRLAEIRADLVASVRGLVEDDFEEYESITEDLASHVNRRGA